MSDHHTYKKIEIVGSSRTSVDEAIQNGVAEACKTLRNVEWFEVGEIRGHVENGQIGHFQVTMKVGFRLADS
ncbi:dodecin [Stutzerimonas stutzeri]|uniref:Dodecin flavoprotein n=1 Tax=Stutzerimonas stutzeri TaxID=316 RepID=A0A6I6LL68_STUST|nr:dodecin [Stutzerimonas stutzeri]QGZ29235.1 dodecin flavoprotein [Stutzerimonas stutzeri]